MDSHRLSPEQLARRAARYGLNLTENDLAPLMEFDAHHRAAIARLTAALAVDEMPAPVFASVMVQEQGS